MKYAWILLGVLIALTSAARAAGLTGYACQGWGLTVLVGPSFCGAGSPPPASCDGAINLSEGCPQPMLGL